MLGSRDGGGGVSLINLHVCHPIERHWLCSLVGYALFLPL